MHKLAQKLYDYAAKVGEKYQNAEIQRLMLKDVERSIEEHRDTIAGQVANEVDDSGKPRYPNEALRRAETVRRLSEDERYQGLLASRETVRQDLLKAEGEYEELKWQQQAVRYHIRLLTAELVAGHGLEVDRKITAGLKEPEVKAEEPVKQEKAVVKTEEQVEFAPDKEILKAIGQAFKQGPLPEARLGELAGQLTRQYNQQLSEEDIAAHLEWLAQRQRVVKRGNVWQLAKTA